MHIVEFRSNAINHVMRKSLTHLRCWVQPSSNKLYVTVINILCLCLCLCCTIFNYIIILFAYLLNSFILNRRLCHKSLPMITNYAIWEIIIKNSKHLINKCNNNKKTSNKSNGTRFYGFKFFRVPWHMWKVVRTFKIIENSLTFIPHINYQFSLV